MRRRSNQAWIEDLRAGRGYEDLARYVYRVAFNDLLKRRADLGLLHSFTDHDLAELALEFAQDVVVKLCENDYARLGKYNGDGAFTSWVARIAVNTVGQELRKMQWLRRERSPEVEGEGEDDRDDRLSVQAQPTSQDADVEGEVMRRIARRAYQACLDRIPKRQAQAFRECVEEGRKAQVVAQEMGCSVGAVYLLVFGAKKSLQKCLRAERIGSDILQEFE